MSDLGFPNNVVHYVADRAVELDGVSNVFMRPLRPMDPNGSVGVFAATWAPEDHNVGQMGPALEQWLCSVQAFVTHMDEQEGLKEHNDLASSVRHMLYRDETFRVGLSGLQYSSMGYLERLQRWGIRQQRFISNEVDANYLYLTVTEFWFETESVRTL